MVYGKRSREERVEGARIAPEAPELPEIAILDVDDVHHVLVQGLTGVVCTSVQQRNAVLVVGQDVMDVELERASERCMTPPRNAKTSSLPR